MIFIFRNFEKQLLFLEYCLIERKTVSLIDGRTECGGRLFTLLVCQEKKKEITISEFEPKYKK
jgi:hypothetical protein